MSNRYRTLLQERADSKGRIDAIFQRLDAEDRDPTAEEKAEIEKGQARLRAIGESLRLYEDQFAAERDLPAIASFRGDGTPAAEAGAETFPTPFRSFGEQLQAVYRAAVNHEVDPRLYRTAAQGAGEAVDSDGGFLVQQDFGSAIERRMYALGDVLGRVRKISVSGNGLELRAIDESSRATGSRWGAVQGYWVDEGTAPTGSRPKFTKIPLRLVKVAALGYATDELLEDAPAMSGIYTEAFAEELLWLVENAIIRGTGAGQPLGVVAHAATVSVSKETGQAASTVVFENITKMWARMWARSRQNAAWLINQDIEPQLMGMSLNVGTGGIPVYLPANGLSGQPFGTLMGRPVLPIEYCSTLGTVGDIILADLSQYLLIDKVGGVRQATSIHVAFTTDEMAFRATYRVDGQPIWRSALTPANGSNTLSPFVTLATRA